MSDTDYWKHRYAHLWTEAAEREERLRKWIERHARRRVVACGLGTASEAFIPGSALQNGGRKGDADLAVEDTNIRIEITGPLRAGVSERSAIWIRPDKIENARGNPHLNHWIVHENGVGGLVRVLHLCPAFFGALDAGRYPSRQKMIRGTRERYHVIPAGDELVRPAAYLEAFLTALWKPSHQASQLSPIRRRLSVPY